MNEVYCLANRTEDGLLAQMLKLGFKRVGANEYEVLDMIYHVSSRAVETPDGLRWIAMPKRNA